MKYAIIVILLCFLIGHMSYAEEIDWDKLVTVVIQVESGGNPNAVSKAGAIGLMQITPIVLEEYYQYSPSGFLCDINLYDYYDNKALGTWYLHRLQDHYGCSTIEQILAAYNGGITRLKRNNWDISKMPRETRQYVKKCMKLYLEV